jgi:hypothetical protein
MTVMLNGVKHPPPTEAGTLRSAQSDSGGRVCFSSSFLLPSLPNRSNHVKPYRLSH